jgi:hypothetical protein
MRIVPAAAVPARPPSLPVAGAHGSPAAIVCAALMLALVFLLFRIAGGTFPDCSFIGDSVDGCPILEIRAG